MTSTEKSSTTSPDDEILEGAMFNVRQTRYLKIIVIVMGLMLVFGFIALAIAVMNKASKKKAARKLAALSAPADKSKAKISAQNLIDQSVLKKDIALDLPKKAKVLSYKVSGTTMFLHIAAKNANQIIVLDMVSGEIKSRIHLP